jgi:hypothetical protein
MSVNVQSAILSLSEEHGGSLSVVVDSKQYTMRNDNPLFGQAVEAYRKEDWDSLMGFLSPEKAVREYLFEYDNVKVENGAVYFGGSAVHSLCVDRILQFCDSGFSPMPLVRFLSKLQKNPSRRSVEELYRFLERNNLTVTTNGNFLAYKAVTSDFFSITAGNAQLLKGKDDCKGRIFNGVGEEIEVYRNYVRNSTVIDLTKTPQHLKDSILECYRACPNNGNGKIFNYLVSKRCNMLVSCVDEFFVQS